MSPFLLGQVLNLSVEGRIRLVEAIWDSIAGNPESLPVTEAQRFELDRRLAEHLRDPKATRSWPEIRESLKSKK